VIHRLRIWGVALFPGLVFLVISGCGSYSFSITSPSVDHATGSGNGSSGGSPSSPTQSATRLEITGPTSLALGRCSPSPFTIASAGASGLVATTADLPVTLGGIAEPDANPILEFYADAACQQTLIPSELKILAGQQTLEFYVKAVLGVSSILVQASAGSLAAAPHGVSIVRVPWTLQWASSGNPTTMESGSCAGPFTFEVLDYDEQALMVSSSLSVAISTSAGYLFSDGPNTDLGGCNQPLPAGPFAGTQALTVTGSATGQVYLRAMPAGLVQLALTFANPANTGGGTSLASVDVFVPIPVIQK
jgi:hypothetical protein